MKLSLRVVVCLSLTGALATVCAADEGKSAIVRLKPLFLATSLGGPGKPQTLIVAGDACSELAQDLQTRIHEATGVKLPVFDDAKALRNLDKKRHLIVLGHYGNNKVIERFNYRGYVIVDGVQPA